MSHFQVTHSTSPAGIREPSPAHPDPPRGHPMTHERRSAASTGDDDRFDYDVIVVGSGFGGSVSALRLTEKGYRVGVLEAGRRFTPDTLPKNSWDLRNFLWAPRLGLFGIQDRKSTRLNSSHEKSSYAVFC